MPRLRALVVWVPVLLGACSGTPDSAVSQSAPPPAALPVHLTRTPKEVAHLCERLVVRQACPGELPTTAEPYRGRALHLSSEYVVLDIACGGPYPGLTRKNAPPRFAHVVIKVGDLGDAYPFTFPSGDAPSGSTARPSSSGSAPLFLGTPTWGGLTGTLILAPPFPRGGIDGDHLIFKWSRAGTDFAVSMHAWRPLASTEATLRSVIDSIPGT